MHVWRCSFNGLTGILLWESPEMIAPEFLPVRPMQQNVTHFSGLLKERFTSPLQSFAKTTWPQAHHNHQYASCFLAWILVFSIPIRAGFLVSCPYPVSCLCILPKELEFCCLLTWWLMKPWLVCFSWLKIFQPWLKLYLLAQRLVASMRTYCGLGQWC